MKLAEVIASVVLLAFFTVNFTSSYAQNVKLVSRTLEQKEKYSIDYFVHKGFIDLCKKNENLTCAGLKDTWGRMCGEMFSLDYIYFEEDETNFYQIWSSGGKVLKSVYPKQNQ